MGNAHPTELYTKFKSITDNFVDSYEVVTNLHGLNFNYSQHASEIDIPENQMENLLKSLKKLISVCLVTVFVVTSALTILPTPARAEGDTIITIDCRYTDNPTCGNVNQHHYEPPIIGEPVNRNPIESILFEAALVLGPVIVSSSVHALGELVVSGAAAAAHAVAVTAVPAIAVVAPVAVPVVATAAVGYGAYRLWEAHQKGQQQELQLGL
ncbi:hypothetical protein [Fortiea contorta]|uniref:hypothetical protein n=1 Tax=Fortiea contorta TaxID=1892405 RepID=UPI00034547B7|nr:hypothetical protein [Fortiea contorta]